MAGSGTFNSYINRIYDGTNHDLTIGTDDYVLFYRTTGNLNDQKVVIKTDGSASFDGGILASDGNISLGFYNEGHISALTGQFGSGTAGQYSSMMDSTGITGFDQNIPYSSCIS